MLDKPQLALSQNASEILDIQVQISEIQIQLENLNIQLNDLYNTQPKCKICLSTKLENELKIITENDNIKINGKPVINQLICYDFCDISYEIL